MKYIYRYSWLLFLVLVLAGSCRKKTCPAYDEIKSEKKTKYDRHGLVKKRGFRR